MACSGAWDWAPYTSTYNDKGAHTMSKGVWKSVYLVGIGKGEAALEHLQPRVYYNGSFPLAPLDDSSAGGWTVEARVHLVSPGAASGTVEVSGQWGGSASTPASLVAGDNIVTVSLTVPAAKVSLWWPNGMGADHLPSLYNLSATWTPAKVRVRSSLCRYVVYIVCTGRQKSPAATIPTSLLPSSRTHSLTLD